MGGDAPARGGEIGTDAARSTRPPGPRGGPEAEAEEGAFAAGEGEAAARCTGGDSDDAARCAAAAAAAAVAATAADAAALRGERRCFSTWRGEADAGTVAAASEADELASDALSAAERDTGGGAGGETRSRRADALRGGDDFAPNDGPSLEGVAAGFGASPASSAASIPPGGATPGLS